MNIIIFALGAQGIGISGGDRIFIEFAREWSKNLPVTIYLSKEGRQMCTRQKLMGKNLNLNISKLLGNRKLGFVLNYFALILTGVKLGLTVKLENSSQTVIYSASEFWMDSLPCFLLKLRYPKAKWVSAWYQTAPNPIRGFSAGRAKLRAFVYWFMQLPIKPLINKFSDFVLVNNIDEKKQFSYLSKSGKVGIVFGAVPLEEITTWRRGHPRVAKNYDAVFQGRFHPQKGVVELVDIWSKVVAKLPSAKLAMVGDGPLMKDVQFSISNFQLEKNIRLFGYVFDGPKKYKIFSQSKLVVHPAFYDSGGMASAEAMAFGIPVVGFDLAAYKSYYPQGMLKVTRGSLDGFASAIVELLKDSVKRKRLGQEAAAMITKNWSWQKRASEILQFIEK